MLDLNKPVQTRDGSPVRILTTDAAIANGDDVDTIVGIVTGEDGRAAVYTWMENGRFLFRDVDNGADLINVPEAATETYHVLSGFSPGYADMAIAIDHAQHRGAMAVIKLTQRNGRVDASEVVYARS